MQAFKIEHYEREHGRGTFVPFRHLADADASSIRDTLKRCLKLPPEIAPKDIAQAIYDKSAPVEDVNAEQANFDLRELLRRLKFDTSESVYLNWYHYDDIDEMQTDDILAMFGDIWYPSSDDLDVIDSKMQWILSIDHSGTIRTLRMGKT